MINKAFAATLFQRYSLEALPAYVIDPSTQSPAQFIRDRMPGATTFTLRACGEGEEKNLPRLVDCSLDEAEQWLRALGGTQTVLVQPYDDLVYSVELVANSAAFIIEVIPGIWELDNQVEPLCIEMTHNEPIRVRGPVDPQRAKYWSAASSNYTVQYACVEDWQIAVLIEWVKEHAAHLDALRAELHSDVGIKLHYSRRYGLSPQNMHTADLALPQDAAAPVPDDVPLITSTQQPLPHCARVRLDLGIAREHHSELMVFASHLQHAGVKTVYVRSGLLSHMAIVLRQCGFKVRRW